MINLLEEMAESMAARQSNDAIGTKDIVAG